VPGDPGAAVVILGDGTGLLGSMIVPPPATPFLSVPVGSGANAVAVGDFNGDGLPDAVTANKDADTVTVLLNTSAPGNLSFSTSTLFTGLAPSDIGVADLNGDGNLDLVVACMGFNQVAVYTGDGTGGFTFAGFFDAGKLPVALAIADPAVDPSNDLNGDGDPDVLTTSGGGPLPDLIRSQGQLTISNSTFIHNESTGVRQLNGTHVQPNAVLGAAERQPVPGPIRKLPAPARGNILFPSLKLINNEFIDNDTGFFLEGQDQSLLPNQGLTTRPHTLIVNNSFASNRVGLRVDPLAAPTILNNIFANNVTGLSIDNTVGPGINPNWLTTLATSVVGHHLFGPGQANTTLGNNPTVADPLLVDPAADLRIQVGSPAIDQALSNLSDRMTNPRAAIHDPIRAPINPDTGTNIERTVWEQTYASERNTDPTDADINQVTDHDSLNRVDDPNTPNIGVGTDPFLDIGAFDLRDLQRPIIRSFGLAVGSDTGAQDEAQPLPCLARTCSWPSSSSCPTSRCRAARKWRCA